MDTLTERARQQRLPVLRPWPVELRLADTRLLVDRASPRDAPGVVSLFRTVLGEDRYFITSVEEYSATPAWQAQVIRTLSGQDNSLFLVGRVDREVVAALTLQGGQLRRMRHTAKLEIFVARRVRGSGVGRALMEAALAWAVHNPVLEKLGLAVFEDNTPAVALYRKLGFEVEGRRVGEYREDDGTLRNDLLMWRLVRATPAGSRG